MNILFLDDYYPDALAHFRSIFPGGDFPSWLLTQCHGTADYWHHALPEHDCQTLIDGVNNEPRFTPDVVCSQNVGRWNAEYIRHRFPGAKAVGFCSYAAEPENLRGWDVLFTSFPWLVGEPHGARYLPLAFAKQCLERIEPQERVNPVIFVGGLGNRIWDAGTKSLARVAELVPEFKWWGYKVGRLPESLERTYQGYAWGLDYFRLLASSRIVINRHGEIAKGFANNMRLFEVTGMGACLLTEHAPNITNFFELGEECFTYRSESELVDLIRWLFLPEALEVLEATAKHGQERCHAEHTYEHRADIFRRYVIR